ncbi:MAG: PIG-L family deacetylase [Gammaproteobacteria bacterium]|nr:PIG-L family deacetylase [Gammaproteobacteria bacterium]
MSLPDSALKNSLLIVAHPDDEILWFGSVAPHVGRIVVCFSHDPAHPELSQARVKTLERHPWADRIMSIGLDETGSFGCASWPLPGDTEFGLGISGSEGAARQYEIRAGQLRTALVPLMENVDNVYTHNPWGEYGHEEHVMVHRVATALAGEAGISTWYNNYASSWSMLLMCQYLDKADRPVISGTVDIETMMAIADIYREAGAWTWFDDYSWFKTEHFVSGPLRRNTAPAFGWMFPVNYLGLADRDEPERRARRPGILGRIRRKFRRYGAAHG